MDGGATACGAGRTEESGMTRARFVWVSIRRRDRPECPATLSHDAIDDMLAQERVDLERYERQIVHLH